MDPSRFFLFRYEDLVGRQGGGDRSKQITEIARLSKFLNITTNKEKIEILADKIIYGKSPTYRVGKINQWKIFFNEDQKLLYDHLYGDDLKFLGYPLSSE